MSDVVERLADLVARAEDEPEWCRNIFSLTVGRSKWTVATDRKWLVAERGNSVVPEITDKGGSEWARQLLQLKPRGARPTSLSSLRAWAGEAPSLDDPYHIDGQRPGGVASVMLDRRRLARLLTAAPEDGDVLLWDARSQTGGVPVLCLLTVGNEWRGCLAGIDCEVDEGDELYGFPEEMSGIEMIEELAAQDP
jgi:hypothetical protein